MREKTDFEILLDVLLIVLTPIAAAGIWFLANVRWWA